MIKKLLTKLFGRKIKNIIISEADEHRILHEMYQIEGIKDYWLLQVQGGYQLYAKTDDRQYLGYSSMAENMVNIFDEMSKEPEDKELEGNGYVTTV